MPDSGKGSVGVGSENEEGSRVKAEDNKDGGDGAGNEEMQDAETEESGADMADNTMDETVH